MPGLQVVNFSFFIVIYSLLNGVGHDGNNSTIEDKGTYYERDTAHEQGPSVYAIYIQIVKGISIYKQIEWKQELRYIAFLCEILPVAARNMQEQP